MGISWSEEEYEEYKVKKIGKPKKKSKYRNKKVTIDGIEFDSKKEAHYYLKLKLLKQAGEIKDFGLQEKFVLQEGFNKNGKSHRPITYYADFIIDNLDGSTDVVDVKGMETQVFKIKKKLFEYKYPDLSIKIIK